MAADSDNCPPVPDTAMATGSDAEPGDHLGDGTLGPGERAVLDELRQGGGEPVVTEAEEDTPAVQEAVEDDSVVRGLD